MSTGKKRNRQTRVKSPRPEIRSEAPPQAQAAPRLGAGPAVPLPHLIVAGALIASCVLLAMGPCLFNKYAGLDTLELLEDSPYCTEGFWKTAWKVLFNEAYYGKAYYPMFQWFLGIDVSLFRLWPPLSFALNVLLHAVNVFLLWFFLRLVLERDAELEPRAALAAATLGALLFAAHPVNVEPVAWVMGRKVLLACFFALLSAASLLREKPGIARNALACFFFLCSVFSNALPIGLPLVFAAYFLILKRHKLGTVVIRMLPMAILMVIVALFRQEAATPIKDLVLPGGKMSNQVGAVLSGQVAQLVSLVYPVGLSHLYPRPAPPYWGFKTVLGIALIIGSFFLALYLWKKRGGNLARVTAFGMAWYWLSLSPTLAHHYTRADRHMYVSMGGLLLIVGLGFALALKQLRGQAGKTAARYALYGIAAAAVVSLAFTTRYYTHIWRTPLALFSRAAEIASNNSKAYCNWGSALLTAGEVERAREVYGKALTMTPVYPDAYLNMALMMEDDADKMPDGKAKLDLYSKAASFYEMGLDMDPNAQGYFFLGRIYQRLGRPDLAIEAFKKEIALLPKDLRGHYHLAIAYAQNKEYDKAEEEFQTAIRIAPKSTDIFYAHGAMWEALGQYDKAIREYTHAVELDENNAKAHYNLGAVYLKSGRTEEAMNHFRKAREIDPTLPDSWTNLGGAHAP